MVQNNIAPWLKEDESVLTRAIEDRDKARLVATEKLEQVRSGMQQYDEHKIEIYPPMSELLREATDLSQEYERLVDEVERLLRSRQEAQG
jgi:hypothetical protein